MTQAFRLWNLLEILSDTFVIQMVAYFNFTVEKKCWQLWECANKNRLRQQWSRGTLETLVYWECWVNVWSNDTSHWHRALWQELSLLTAPSLQPGDRATRGGLETLTLCHIAAMSEPLWVCLRGPAKRIEGEGGASPAQNDHTRCVCGYWPRTVIR